MDIQKYYKLSAITALNASLISCIPILIIVISFIGFHIPSMYLLLMVPFCLFSIMAYIQFFVYQRRSQKIPNSLESKSIRSLIETKTVLLTFLPAPSLRMLIFDRDGTILGEIRDRKFRVMNWYLPTFLDKLHPKSYDFYNSEEELQYKFIVRKNGIEIYNKEEQVISKISREKSDKRSNELYFYGKNKVLLKKSLTFTELAFIDETGLELASLKKGWMPKEWGKRFLDSNLPILSINHSASNKDLIHIYAMLTPLFAYRDH